MNIRKFIPKDAEFCFKTRSNAFIQKFYNEIGAKAAAAGVNAYMPNDYIRMSNEIEFFIVEKDCQSVGFFTIKRIDLATAEIPLIYLDLNYLSKGIGKACFEFIEEWLYLNWREVTKLIVDTIIPKYNGGFYKKVGFVSTAEVDCEFPDLRIKALRFSKNLISNSS